MSLNQEFVNLKAFEMFLGIQKHDFSEYIAIVNRTSLNVPERMSEKLNELAVQYDTTVEELKQDNILREYPSLLESFKDQMLQGIIFGVHATIEQRLLKLCDLIENIIHSGISIKNEEGDSDIFSAKNWLKERGISGNQNDWTTLERLRRIRVTVTHYDGVIPEKFRHSTSFTNFVSMNNVASDRKSWVLKLSPEFCENMCVEAFAALEDLTHGACKFVQSFLP